MNSLISFENNILIENFKINSQNINSNLRKMNKNREMKNLKGSKHENILQYLIFQLD